jgi:tetratricopeptide (TPR) repeat protein
LPDVCRDDDAELSVASDLNAAAVRYEQLLAADPDQWDVLYLYGTALLQLGRLGEAIDVFSRVIRLRPEIPDVHNNLAVAFQSIGDQNASLKAYSTAIELNPDLSLAHANLGRLLECMGRFAEAEVALRHAIRSQPQNLELKLNLAACLVHQERLAEAADVYQAVIDTNPDFAEAHGSLAYVLERQGRLEDALAAAKRAVGLRPDYAEGFNNLGIVLRSQHQLDEAIDAFGRAIELNPQFALAEFNLGTTLLLAGRYAEGWAGYRQHTRIAGTAAPGPPEAEWDGRPIPGRRLLICADQGLGDTIQFARFLPLCKQRSQADVIFRCQPALLRLFAERRDFDELCSTDEKLPSFDRHCSLASLCGLFGLTIDEVGIGAPYLSSAATLPPQIAELLGDGKCDRRVGLVWQGNPRQTQDIVRSCPFEKLPPLFDLSGIRWLSLQHDPIGRAQLATSRLADRLPDVGGLLEDFADTATVLERLDLLITVDTAIAHLAGALGRPVWTMLCHTPDWRWHLDRCDSPWYPSMRLFRQPRWGDWEAVVEQIRLELQNR